MKINEVMEYLEEHGSEQTKKIYLSHGAKEPLFGVKTSDLKELKKKIKINHELAIELYKTGNSDAMYFGGLIVDINKVTIDLLNEWVELAYWSMLSERSVAVVAAKTNYGFDVARSWIKNDKDEIKCAGYATFSTMFSFIEDDKINLDEVKDNLDFIAINIHNYPLNVQNAMNNYLIMAGIYIKPIYDYALTVAHILGRVEPTIKENNCNVQTAVDYLVKYYEKGKIGIKIKNLNR